MMIAVRSIARIAAVAFLTLLARCAPVDLLNATIKTEDVTITRDIPYMPGPRGMMDVYRPTAAAGPLPVVVFFYGGAWRTGKRQDYLFAATELARRGMVVVVPDYRLYPEVPYPVFLQDAASAVATVQLSAASWGGDPRRVVVAGHSAGAWIAAMLALDPEWLAAAGDGSPLVGRDNLAGMVGLAGPYDFLPITGADVQQVFAAAPDKRDTQPITYADGRNPPMLLLHGDDDDTVYPRNSLALANSVRAAGGTVQETTYPGDRPCRHRHQLGAAVPRQGAGVGRHGRFHPVGAAPLGPVEQPGRRRFSWPRHPAIQPPVQSGAATQLARNRSHPGHRRDRLRRLRRRPRAAGARPRRARLLARPGSDRRNLDGLAAEIVEGDLTDPASLARAVTGCRYVAACGRRLPHLGARPRRHAARQRGGHRRPDAGGAGGRRRADRLLQQRRRAGPDQGRHPGRRDHPGHRGHRSSASTRNPSSAPSRRCWRWSATAGLPAVIVNPAAPVGPRDIKPTPTGRMIADAAAGRMPAYVDTGLNIVHVDDVAEGHMLALERGRIGETLYPRPREHDARRPAGDRRRTDRPQPPGASACRTRCCGRWRW